tara:strand:+ start:19937 stop:20257 length:321 start_codon:yes stop_codon:yes gene_type:complete
MAKRRDLNLDEYLEETTKNIREDRAMAKTLLMDVMADMKGSSSERREMGPIAAKFVENLQRSNEQLVKLAVLLQRQAGPRTGLSENDKESLFDLLNNSDEEPNDDH